RPLHHRRDQTVGEPDGAVRLHEGDRDTERSRTDAHRARGIAADRKDGLRRESANERAGVRDGTGGFPSALQRAGNAAAPDRARVDEPETVAPLRHDLALDAPCRSDEYDFYAGSECRYGVRHGDHRKDVTTGAPSREENRSRHDCASAGLTA